ncbi:MAG: hypothetical protein LUE86_07985 [Clostridiales bacterium]|nr:hypothetical protein [Clostridiales bacterium]
MFGKKEPKHTVSGAFFSNPSEALMSKDEIAEFLGTSPEALAPFEEGYAANILSDESVPDNLFSVSAKQAAGMRIETGDDGSNPELEARIVAETEIFCYDGEQVWQENVSALRLPGENAVTSQEILAVLEAQRPELSDKLPGRIRKTEENRIPQIPEITRGEKE